MTTFIKGFIAAVVIFGNINFSYEDPTQCYGCGQQWPIAEQRSCNDPMDKSAVQTDHCSDPSFMSFMSNHTQNETDTWLSKIPAAKADAPLICYKLSLSAGSSSQTIRGCAYSVTNGVSYCDFNKQMASQLGVKFHGCTTCKSNMCNSGTSIFISAVTLMCGILVKLVI